MVTNTGETPVTWGARISCRHCPMLETTATVIAACFLFGILLTIFDGGRPTIPLMTAAALLFAALLSLAQLAPTYQLTNLSVAQFRADYLGAGGGVPATALVSLVWPNYYHIFEPAQYKLPVDLTYMYLYCGMLGLLFGLAGVVLAGRSKLNRVFAILLLAGVLATLGATTWVGRMALSLIPLRIGIGLEPEISAAVLCLSLAVLAALALDRLVPNQRLACALAATLCRQLGLAVPMAFAVCLLWNRGLAGRWVIRALVPLAVCLGALLTFQQWLKATGRLPALYSLQNGEFLSALCAPKRLLPGLAKHIGTALLYLGWFSLPVMVLVLPAAAAVRRGRRVFMIAGGVFILCSIIVLALTRGSMPTAGNIVLAQGIGPLSLRDVHILNLPHVPALWKGFWLAVTAASLLGGALLVGAAAGAGLPSGAGAAGLFPGREIGGDLPGLGPCRRVEINQKEVPSFNRSHRPRLPQGLD